MWPAIVIFLLGLAMHLPWLGISPIAGTEGHRIFPAHAMVQSGWWSVPMLFGQPLLSKPPLHHWLIALSETIGAGETCSSGGFRRRSTALRFAPSPAGLGRDGLVALPGGFPASARWD